MPSEEEIKTAFTSLQFKNSVPGKMQSEEVPFFIQTPILEESILASLMDRMHELDMTYDSDLGPNPPVICVSCWSNMSPNEVCHSVLRVPVAAKASFRKAAHRRVTPILFVNTQSRRKVKVLLAFPRRLVIRNNFKCFLLYWIHQPWQVVTRLLK
jgi:hypothetical protein